MNKETRALSKYLSNIWDSITSDVPERPIMTKKYFSSIEEDIARNCEIIEGFGFEGPIKGERNDIAFGKLRIFLEFIEIHKESILSQETSNREETKIPTDLILPYSNIASIREDAAPHQYSEEEDPMMIYKIYLWNELVLSTEDHNPKEIALQLRYLAIWLKNSAKWFDKVESRGNRCFTPEESKELLNQEKETNGGDTL